MLLTAIAGVSRIPVRLISKCIVFHSETTFYASLRSSQQSCSVQQEWQYQSRTVDIPIVLHRLGLVIQVDLSTRESLEVKMSVKVRKCLVNLGDSTARLLDSCVVYFFGREIEMKGRKLAHGTIEFMGSSKFISRLMGVVNC